VRPCADAAEQAARLFAALAAESRLRILRLLAGDVFCVGALSRLTGISAGAVSQHLRILRSAGLVEPERRGYFVHYRLATGASRLLTRAVSDVLKPGKGAGPCVAKKRSASARKS
jgi:DNA-binding transcriptional ArsR family regulator